MTNHVLVTLYYDTHMMMIFIPPFCPCSMRITR